jgi:ERCC4-type nuclease
MKKKFWVIRDTREKVGFWDYPEDDRCYGTKSHKLNTGDYSVEGFENLLCIERKKTVSELVNNISEKRFKDVLQRMSTYKYKFIVLEFDLTDIARFPVGSGIPKSKWGYVSYIKPAFLLRYISELCINYGIQVIFASDKNNAEKMTYSIIKRVIDNEPN